MGIIHISEKKSYKKKKKNIKKKGKKTSNASSIYAHVPTHT